MSTAHTSPGRTHWPSVELGDGRTPSGTLDGGEFASGGVLVSESCRAIMARNASFAFIVGTIFSSEYAISGRGDELRRQQSHCEPWPCSPHIGLNSRSQFKLSIYPGFRPASLVRDGTLKHHVPVFGICENTLDDKFLILL